MTREKNSLTPYSFCQSSTTVLAAAERSGLSSLTLVEAETGRTFIWIRGVDGWR